MLLEALSVIVILNRFRVVQDCALEIEHVNTVGTKWV